MVNNGVYPRFCPGSVDDIRGCVRPTFVGRTPCISGQTRSVASGLVRLHALVRRCKFKVARAHDH